MMVGCVTKHVFVCGMRRVFCILERRCKQCMDIRYIVNDLQGKVNSVEDMKSVIRYNGYPNEAARYDH